MDFGIHFSSDQSPELNFIFTLIRDRSQTLVRGTWCKKGALKIFDPCKGGGLKKITTDFPLKIKFTCFSRGWPVIFMAKRDGPEIFLRSEGGPKNIFCIRPPLQVFVNSPLLLRCWYFSILYDTSFISDATKRVRGHVSIPQETLSPLPSTLRKNGNQFENTLPHLLTQFLPRCHLTNKQASKQTNKHPKTKNKNNKTWLCPLQGHELS